MSKGMSNFKFANKATADMKQALKLPNRRKAVIRSFDSSIDGLQDTLIDLEATIVEARDSLYTTADSPADKKSCMDTIVESTLLMEETKAMIDILIVEKEYVDAEAIVEEED